MKFITDINRKWWTLGVVSFALFMIVLDGNVVNLAIPKILKDFNATLPQIEWISNAYLLAFAIFLITFGRLGDMIGRKKMFSAGITLFVIGSLLCGSAANSTQLIIFRIIQGLGAACMMPATLSLISANFERKERGMAMGIWGAVSGLAIVAGPILGGYITDRGLGHVINDLFGISQYWRYVFYINLPFGLVALLLTFLAIGESKDAERRHRIDFGGILLSALSVFFLTFAFIEGQKYGWWKTNTIPELFGRQLHFGSISIIPALFALSFISMIIFVLYERRVKVDPMMDVKLFNNWNFSAGNFSIAVVSFATMGAFFLLPLFLQSVLGYSALKVGFMMLPFAGAVIFTAPIGGKLTDKIGGKWVIFSGMALITGGMFVMGHFRLDTAFKDLILPSLLLGAGMGLTNGPLSTVTLLDIPPAEFGGASGVAGTMRQVGSVMGIAVLGAFLQSNMAAGITTNIDHIKGLPGDTKSRVVAIAKSNEGKMGANTDSQKQLRDTFRSQIAAQIKAQVTTQMKKEMKSMQPPAKPPVIPANLPPQTKLNMQKKMREQQAKMVMQIQARQSSIVKSVTAATLDKYKRIGADIQTSVKQGFTDSINTTLRSASLIALFGAMTALLLRNKRRIPLDQPARNDAGEPLDPIEAEAGETAASKLT